MLLVVVKLPRTTPNNYIVLLVIHESEWGGLELCEGNRH